MGLGSALRRKFIHLRCQHGCGYRTRSIPLLSIHYQFDHAGDPVVPLKMEA